MKLFPDQVGRRRQDREQPFPPIHPRSCKVHNWGAGRVDCKLCLSFTKVREDGTPQEGDLLFLPPHQVWIVIAFHCFRSVRIHKTQDNKRESQQHKPGRPWRFSGDGLPCSQSEVSSAGEDIFASGTEDFKYPSTRDSPASTALMVLKEL